MSPRSRRWGVVALVTIGLVIAAVLIWGGDDEDVVGSGDSTTSSSRASTSSTTSSTAPSTTSSIATTTTGTPPPNGVSNVTSGSAGGSGEVFLDWSAVPGANGYRVLRAGAPDGQFTVVATIDVTTGAATAGPEVVNIWSDAHSYVPADGPLTARDTSPVLHYVDVGEQRPRCFKVVAYNEGGDALPSTAACGSPP